MCKRPHTSSPSKISAWLVIGIASLLVGCGEGPQRSAAKSASLAKPVDPKACLLDSSIHQKYADFTAKGDHWKAARSISNCADTSQDASLLAKVKESEIKVWIADFKDKNKTATERAQAYEKLKELDASEALQLEQEFKAVSKQAGLDAEISRRVTKENLRYTGANIGMTASQVAQSNWGYPSNISKITTPYGTREQWSYGGGRYLYFDNGVLTAIQE